MVDVAWVSEQRLDMIEDEVATSTAPEICIEAKFASNTVEEMLEKKTCTLVQMPKGFSFVMLREA